MKKFIISFLSIIVFTSNIFAISPALKTVSVDARARIINPITISNSQALDFGIIACGTSLSTIVVAPNASPTINVTSGDAVVLTSTPQTAAKFIVTGENMKTFSVNIPSTVTIISGVNSLTINNFTSSIVGSGTISINNIFYVGGTLSVPSTAVSASYSGTFNVTVAYN